MRAFALMTLLGAFVWSSLAGGAAAGRQIAPAAAPPVSAQVDPGQAMSRVGQTLVGIGNRALMATWSVANGRLKPASFEDRLTSRRVPVPPEAFALVFEGGRVVRASEMKVAGAPRVEILPGDASRSRLAERLPGKQLVIALEAPDGGFGVTWTAVVRDGSSYVRQEIVVSARRIPLPLERVTFLDVAMPGASVAGAVQGSPVVAGGAFIGVEHPMSQCEVEGGVARCSLVRALPVPAGQNISVSVVSGVTAPGQLRRGFLAYLERERAHPYRPFLHYNSWYDLGYFSKFDEKAALDVIETFGRELVVRRSVQVDSFLFDDGWDDPRTLWRFHEGFPEGFAKVQRAAEKFGAAPGVWLSPWGGYGEPKKQRLAAGAEQGFETNERGFALSGPIYYRRFHDTCLEFVRTYGVNQFKFDGIGRATGIQPGSAFGSDFEAAIQLIEDLRAERPEVFINLTTGTWPSPFWLRHADSIWRGGEDHDFTGTGSDRQQWITYRDAQTYANVVKRGPLYPLNSLMLHGLVYARHAKRLDTDPQADFASEVRSYFGSGTGLQEMYVTPALLGPRDWDVLAEAAQWARRNAAALADTHWVGGDPAALEVYGWASWSRDEGHLVLRNPSAKPASFAVEIGKVLELPADQPKRWRGRSPWKEDRSRPAVDFQEGAPRSVDLGPFEVLTLDLTPLAAAVGK
ncbi:MAG: enterotoxin [Vicinamibacterales bacterium]